MNFTYVFGRTILALGLLALPASASAASIYLDPATGTYGPGDTFVINIRLNTDGQCINAANVALTYPADSLKAVDFSKGGSIFSLWVNEPKLNTEKGTVSFAGGIPGGYCGRAAGDPALTNTIGKVVFTVTSATSGKAVIHLSAGSSLYLNDGHGTKIAPELNAVALKLVSERQSTVNPWVSEVKADTIPPDPFEVQVQSTGNVFDGKYYAVFSTVDKQSGIDHYEMQVNGAWQQVRSPHVLADQSLASDVEVRAIDKAGNIRMGTYVPATVIPRQTSLGDYLVVLIVLLLLAAALIARHHLNKKKEVSAASDTVDLRS
jgi:hypothetical protein